MDSKLDTEDKSFKEEFSKWKKKNKQTIEFFEKSPDAVKTFLFAHADFWYERVNNGWDDSLSLIKQQAELLERQRALISLLHKTIPEARRFGEEAVLSAYGDKIKQAERHQEALALGRKKGTLARQNKAKKNREALQLYIEQYYENPNNPGATLTNKQVADWVHKGFGRYKYNTILGYVKRIAAEHRKKKRQSQA